MKKNRKPNLEDFAAALGLSNRIHTIYEKVTYNWTLHIFLREPEPLSFDFIFLDGAHIWEPDALAFLLSWRFLEPNGLFLFQNRTTYISCPRDIRIISDVYA